MLSSNSLPYTLLYSTEIIPGAVNYQTETRVLSINTNLHATGGIWLSSVERALKAVYDGLNATKRKEVWGLQNWPSTGVTNLKPFDRKSKSFSITAELVNSNNNVIGSTTFQANGWWGFSTSWNSGPVISVSDDDRKQISFNVKADDITDKLTIRIASVNGIEAETAARTRVLQIKAISKEEWNYYNTFFIKRGIITGYNGNGGDLVIPNIIWDEPVSYIGPRAFQGKKITSIKIPDSVISIGDSAFENNNISKIDSFGNRVTSIGNRAFYNSFEKGYYIGITIPNSVNFIGNNAFANNNINRIIIGANVNIADNAFIQTYTYTDSKGYSKTANEFFSKYYNENGKKAGYYEFKNNSWHTYTKEELQDRDKRIKLLNNPFIKILLLGALIGGIVIIVNIKNTL